MFNSLLIAFIFLFGAKTTQESKFTPKDAVAFQSAFQTVFQAGMNKTKGLLSLKGTEKLQSQIAGLEKWSSTFNAPGFCCASIDVGGNFTQFSAIHEIKTEEELTEDANWLLKQTQTALGADWKQEEMKNAFSPWSFEFQNANEPKLTVSLIMTHVGELGGNVEVVVRDKE